MLNLPGHILGTLIHESAERLVFGARRETDGTAVVAKLFRQEFPRPHELVRLRHEFEILASLDLPGVVKPYGLVPYGNGLALVLESIDAAPLNQRLLEGAPGVHTCLRIACSVAEILAELHQRGIIHKNIKPHHILFDKHTGKVSLIDFGIASRASQEIPQSVAPRDLEGTLGYMSPEQTGRMNRVLDHRTDLYSFGVTLYEMLTGTLPFTSTDPMDLVREHLAKVPTAPHKLRPEIPEPLSRMVVKLVAKAAEDRYQNASGLLADLRSCVEAWERQGTIAPFPLGSKDKSANLNISQKLYGREQQIASLLSAYEQARHGHSRWIVVSGPAGIGKTAVLGEFERALVQQGGELVSGKFERFPQTLPFAAFMQAFRALHRRRLTQTAGQLAELKTRLTTHLGANGRLVTDLVPDLELIIGPQPPVVSVGPTEAQNRFGDTLLSFIRSLSCAAHPLVLMVDDLQWADPASLWLLRRLLMDSDNGHLVLVLSYRSNEVDAAHPLYAILQELVQRGLKPLEIALEPLTHDDVCRQLADSLQHDVPERLEGLARQVHAKSQGHPFFVIQFLRAIQQEKLLWLDNTINAWVWDEAGIAAAPRIDNVADFMAAQIGRLPSATQRMLGIAACMGAEFELSLLSGLAETSRTETTSTLLPALQEALLAPLSGSYRATSQPGFTGATAAEPADGDAGVCYRFLHDQVRQAAYLRLPDSERQVMHRLVGRKLRQKLAAEPRAEVLFEAVHHLNSAGEQISELPERHDLAQLNQRAGRMAADTTDYAAAVDFLRAAVGKLGSAGWQENAELAYALLRDLSEYEYLAGQLERANNHLEDLLGRAESDQQRAEILGWRIRLLTSQGRFQEGVMAGLGGLERYGIGLPKSRRQGQEMFFAEIAAIDAILAARGTASLADAPVLEDPDKIAVLRLMVDLSQPAYQVARPIGALIVAQQVHYSLRHGHSRLSPYGYVAYGLIVAGLLGRYRQAIEIGRLALELVKRFDARDMACKVGCMFGIYSGYAQPLRESIKSFAQAQRDGLETGDHVYASLAFSYLPLTELRLGESLLVVRAEVERGLTAMKRTRDEINTEALRLLRQFVTALEGGTNSPTSLNGADFDETAWLARAEAIGFAEGSCLLHTYKLQLAYLHEDYQLAMAMAAEAELTLASALGMHWTTDILFYGCLALTAVNSGAEGAVPAEALARHSASLATLAEACPANEQHRYLLVSAEIARLSGEYLRALDLFEEAIARARENGFLQHEALAKELCAKLHLARGNTTIAKVYLVEARSAYESWGAAAKVARLDQKYGELIGDSVAPAARLRAPSATDTTATVSLSGHLLDVASVLKTAQAISSEIILDKVLDRMMHILVANAGAQRGFLILERDGELWVEATLEVNPERVEVALHTPVSARNDLAQSIINYVARSRQPLILSDASSDARFAHDSYIAASRPKSLLCLALLHQGRLVGLLYLENNVARGAFTSQRVELLRLLSAQAAISVENAQLYSNLQAATIKLRQINETLEQQVAQRTAELSKALAELWSEMGLASKIQSVLLPTQIEIPGYDVSAMLRPAANVGGDYYDIFRATGTDWILIGDVSGHGITAGLIMMMVQTAVRSVIRTLQRVATAPHPADVLTLVNSAIHQNLSQIGKDQYMTITALSFRGGQFCYSGQHQDILVYRAAQKQVERIETVGTWLGILPTIDGMLKEDYFSLEPGDMVLLFTDGITEAQRGKRQYLYTSGLSALFHEIATQDASPEAVIKHVQERVKDYVINDDMTLIALKRKPLEMLHD